MQNGYATSTSRSSSAGVTKSVPRPCSRSSHSLSRTPRCGRRATGMTRAPPIATCVLGHSAGGFAPLPKPPPGRIGGGLDGPLRGLPHEKVAPAKPALEQCRHIARGLLGQPPGRIGGGLDGPLRGLPHEKVAPAKPALEQCRHIARGLLGRPPGTLCEPQDVVG